MDATDTEVIKKSPNKMFFIMIIAAILVIASVAAIFLMKDKDAASSAEIDNSSVVMVDRGSLDNVISGSGTVEPITKHDITSLVTGKIVSSPPEEGEFVEKDALLYKFDDTDIRINIDKTYNSLEKARLANQANLDAAEKLVIYAPCDGKLVNFSLKLGDFVQGNGMKIGEIYNDSYLKVKVPFSKSQIEGFYIGQSAKITSALHMSEFGGKVEEISSVPIRSSQTGSILYEVTIGFQNPGTITKGLSVTALVGDVSSPAEGVVENSKEMNVIAEGAGKIIKLNYEQNQLVTAGSVIAVLENETLSNALKKSSMDLKDVEYVLDQLQKQLKDFSILSPISGTVVKKFFKEDDQINAMSINSVLMRVADMSKCKFFINVDELDIVLVKEGQTVNITCDAVKDKDFKGYITKISKEGISQNGVTTYPVEVTIDELGSLMPGMNVDAKIIFDKKENIIRVKKSAVKKLADKAYVFIKGTENDIKSENKTEVKVPKGFYEKEIVIGAENKDYIEIISGLNEGDIVIDLAALGAKAGNK